MPLTDKFIAALYDPDLEYFIQIKGYNNAVKGLLALFNRFIFDKIKNK